MTGIDIAIIIVLLLSAVPSYVRGFLREAISLATWVGAVVITLAYTSRFSTLLPRDVIQSPAARATISAIALFMICLSIGWLARWLCRRIIAGRKVGVPDRLLGALFGLARGGVLVALVVLAAHLAPTLQQEAWWSASRLLPYWEELAEAIHERLPEDVAQHFVFTTVSI